MICQHLHLCGKILRHIWPFLVTSQFFFCWHLSCWISYAIICHLSFTPSCVTTSSYLFFPYCYFFLWLHSGHLTSIYPTMLQKNCMLLALKDSYVSGLKHTIIITGERLKELREGSCKITYFFWLKCFLGWQIFVIFAHGVVIFWQFHAQQLDFHFSFKGRKRRKPET